MEILCVAAARAGCFFAYKVIFHTYAIFFFHTFFCFVFVFLYFREYFFLLGFTWLWLYLIIYFFVWAWNRQKSYFWNVNLTCGVQSNEFFYDIFVNVEFLKFLLDFKHSFYHFKHFSIDGAIVTNITY